ncbi:MAG TPA: FkbM family methyltransferase [Longimicrobium sp.]
MLRLPIIAGPLRGRWWLPASRGKVLRVLGGSYEPEQTGLFERHVRPGHTVLDVGAHVGYYTLLSAVLAGPGGAVWSFEPNPRNARFLRSHAEINGLRAVRVTEAAVAASDGTARFDFGSGSGTGHLATAGEIEVRTVRLDGFCAENGIAPAVIKIDVEGAETDVLEGARDTLARYRPVIFLSTHGAEVHRACLAFMAGAGYECRAVLGDDVENTSELLCTPRGA